MDCDSCGRHRPSSEIAPLLGADGRLVMACSRCRRIRTDYREPAALAPVSAERPAPALVTVPRR